jgi:hypothetical protein
MEINQKLFGIIFDELGKNSATLFANFFHGFELDEQVRGAHEILSLTVGPVRAQELLKQYSDILKP